MGICFFHLRLRLVRRTLDIDAAHALVRTLIHSRLDYCNSVLAGLPAYMFKRLQSVLNAAARLILQLPGCQSVSIPMREKLHWLGFPHRVTYVVCLGLQRSTWIGTRLLVQTMCSSSQCSWPWHISGRLQLDSSWCQSRTNRRLKTKGSHTVALWHGTISPYICGVMTAPHHWTVFKKHLKTALFKLTTHK